MSEVKTVKCDECQCLLASDLDGHKIGITDVHVNLGMDITYKGKSYGLSYTNDKLDFCDLEHLTSYIAFLITEHFMEPCGGEKNEETRVSEVHGSDCGTTTCAPGVGFARTEDSIPCDPNIGGNS